MWYGADCDVPCPAESSTEGNEEAGLEPKNLWRSQRGAIDRNVLSLFSEVAKRLEKCWRSTNNARSHSSTSINVPSESGLKLQVFPIRLGKTQML